ncbi:MAG: hypothetical protein KAH03_03295 [Cocleimonas sp.]|nr:hypothetical protein [Cocleimonas sp.]
MDDGINRCFYDSVSAGVLCGFVFFCGILQCVMYSRYGQKVDQKRIPPSWAVYVQVSLSMLMVVGAVVYMILQNLTLQDQVSVNSELFFSFPPMAQDHVHTVQGKVCALCVVCVLCVNVKLYDQVSIDSK